MSLVFWVPVSESPPLSLHFLRAHSSGEVHTEVPAPAVPLRSPFPAVLSCSGAVWEKAEKGDAIHFAQGSPLPPHPPSSSCLGLDIFQGLRVFDLRREVGVDLMEHKQERRGTDQAKESDHLSPLPHSSEGQKSSSHSPSWPCLHATQAPTLPHTCSSSPTHVFVHTYTHSLSCPHACVK